MKTIKLYTSYLANQVIFVLVHSWLEVSDVNKSAVAGMESVLKHYLQLD